MDVKIDVSNLKIETNRLILRAFQETDLNDYFEYASVPGVGEMAGWNHYENIETSKIILDEFILQKNNFAIVLKENNKVIGSLGLHNSWANDDEKYKMLKQKGIGFVLSKDYWGRGLMPEAVSALIEYCFNNLDLDAITCECFKINDRSKRVIEKCGFKFVKESEYFAKLLQKTFTEEKYILLHG